MSQIQQFSVNLQELDNALMKILLHSRITVISATLYINNCQLLEFQFVQQ